MESIGRTTLALPILTNIVMARAVASVEPQLAQELALGKLKAAVAFPAIVGSPDNVTYDLDTAPIAFAGHADVLLLGCDGDSGCQLAWIDLRDAPERRREAVVTVDPARGFARLDLRGLARHAVGDEQSYRHAFAEAVRLTAHEQIGGASECLRLACDYARERTAFGQPIGRFQAVKHKLADLYVAIEVARGCVAALGESSGQQDWLPVATARLAATRAYELAAREAIQTFGAMGVICEMPLHYHYRRARSLSVELGSSLWWQEQLLEQVTAGSTS
jgi:alkylation response protein AidB-like acyl-CoA dehydrogenase